MITSTETRQAPEQLALLQEGDLPLQFRLSQRTRERGLAHIAAIKAQLAAKATTSQPTTPAGGPTRVQRAA
jgi:hypothetical protein